jgi:superfamily II DNA helicase RecQ
MVNLAGEHIKIIDRSVANELAAKKEVFDREVFQVGEKFLVQLRELTSDNNLPEATPAVQERIRQASVYFTDKLKSTLLDFVGHLAFDIDNKEIKKQFDKTLEHLHKELFVKHLCINDCKGGFDVLRHLRSRSAAEIEYKAPSAKRVKPVKTTPAKGGYDPFLYEELRKWRDRLARELGIPAYMVLQQKSMMELVDQMPVNTAGLKLIAGIGPAKIKRFGKDIVEIIESYRMRAKE